MVMLRNAKYGIIHPAMKNVLVVTHTTLPHAVEKFTGIFTCADALGWRCSILETAPIGKASLADAILAFRPDGIIHEGPVVDGGVPAEIRRRLPVVWLDPDGGGRSKECRVAADNGRIAELALEELKLAGARSYLFVSLFAGARWSQERERRFLQLAAGAPSGRVAMTGGGMVKAFERRLGSALGRLKAPVGVFAVNDRTAVMALDCARRAGRVCGRDYLLVSVDNDRHLCENAAPPLTSVAQDFLQVGRIAARMLDRLMRGALVGGGEELSPPLGVVRRASSVPSSDKGVSPLSHKVYTEICLNSLSGGSVGSVCAAAGASRRLCEMRFKSEYGKTIRSAILDQRFAEVERLLGNPSQLLEPIANLCGWSSSAHLKRMFKARYGMTMSAWRAKRLG